MSQRPNNSRQKGQNIIEYAIILLLIGMAVVLVLQALEPVLGNVFSRFAFTSPVSPPSVIGYTPPPTYTPDATSTLPPGVTPSSTPTHTATPIPTNTPTETATPTFTPTTEPCDLPLPWVAFDVGAVGAAGRGCEESGVYTLDGSGADIWGTADEFQYTHQIRTGDTALIARVVSQSNTNAWAKAGVMVRQSVSTSSPNVFMALTPGNGTTFQDRIGTGNSTSATTPGDGINAPYWVKIERTGNLFSGYKSSDGSTWVLVGVAVVPMSPNTYWGLAVTSHNDGVLSTAVFDNVSFGSVAATPTPTPSPSATPTASPSPTPTSTPTPTPSNTPGPTATAHPGGEVLFLVDKTDLRNAEIVLRDRLLALGYTVTVVADDDAVVGDATGKVLMLVSGSVDDGKILDMYRDVAVPAIIWEEDLYNDFGMTGDGGSDHGRTGSELSLVINNPSHPLTAGYFGTTLVLSSGERMTWGLPAPSAILIATEVGEPLHHTIFAYESGALMVGGIFAPARRVGFWLEKDTAESLNAAGMALFDAAVWWAIVGG